MTLDQLFADAESKISVVLGGTTTLSNPSENWPDPLVQIIGVALAGQKIIDDKISSQFDYFNIKTADCACLDTIASLVGEYKRENKSTKVGIIITGVNGYTLPTNTLFFDQLGRSWRTSTLITITNGVGVGKAVSSSYGEFLVSPQDLYLQTTIPEVSVATNTHVIEYGYTIESCEQFRTRLLNKLISAPETELTVIEKLLVEADFVKFITDYPSCTDACYNSGFVIRGGNDTTLANIIRDYAPLNYMKLVGNTTVSFDNCEHVKFIRPCPVGIEINYYADNEIDQAEFENIICNSNDSLLSKNFSSIDCLNGITFRVIRATNPDLDCDTQEQISGCGSTFTLSEFECPCISNSCNDTIFKNCAVLNSWEYPVLMSANYLGVDC